ncbi:MAG: myo-inositol-1-phosphate synthase [Candidatus Poribacteria bacterium]|nr:MAG: myo-inositol-1-phosphate synthase [Candidatus Poribacteria bacterium]
MGKVRIAIVGAGNCASALVQGLYYYRNTPDEEFVPGLMHVRLGGYHVGDVEVVAAFDVDEQKVGKDLSEALRVPLNNTIQFAEIPKMDVPVLRGPTLDGLGKYYRQTIQESDQEPVDVARVLQETNADILVNYLPVGSERATRWYMEQALKAGVGVVNCIPVFIARDPSWAKRFEEAGLPIVGDDIKAQVGATIVHRVLTRLLNDRGVLLERTSQLNVGGNMDFMNMLEKERLESKRISKTDAVTSQLSYKVDPRNVYIGPSDYVPWLEDRKWCYLYIEGREFGDVPVRIELKLEVWDSPNSAGVAIDAIRCCKLALDRGIAGALIGPSAYFMKSPPVQYTDAEAHEMVEQFIAGR